MLAVALEPVAAPKQPTVTVAAVRETVTYTMPVSEAALPQSLFRAALAGHAAKHSDATVDMMATPVELITASAAPVAAAAPALTALPPAQAAAKPAAVESVVISLPEAAAEQASRQERTAWEMAHQAGFDAEQTAALEPQAHETDELRTLSMRFAPERRDG